MRVSLFRLIVMLLLTALTACTGVTEPPPLSYTGPLSVQAPRQAPVAQSLTLSIHTVNAPEGLPVIATAFTSFGPRVYQTSVQSGVANVTLPITDTQYSGWVTLAIRAGESLAQTDIEFIPGPAVDPVTPLVGPRTIIADGKHWSMAVAMPFDAWGNPLTEGTRVHFQAMHPDGILESLTQRVEHLLSWVRVWSRTQAGHTTITVSTGEAYGPEADLHEVPGWPIPFMLKAYPQSLPADGRQLMRIRTTLLRDRFGNAVADGTQVTFLVDSGDGQVERLPSVTIAGEAEISLQAASQPGTYRIRASVFDVMSAPLEVDFSAGPAIGSYPVVAVVQADERWVQLTAGPLLGPLDQHIPDGSLVQFLLSSETGQTRLLEAPAEAGYAALQIHLNNLPPGEYLVQSTAGSGSGSTSFEVP